MVDCPRIEGPAPAPVPAVAVVAGAAEAVVAFVAVAAVEGVEVAGLLNRLNPEAAGWVAIGAAVVAADAGVLVAGLAPPRLGNRPPAGAAAVVVDGAAEDVTPPREGKRDFWGAALDAAGAPGAGWDVVVVVEGAPRENAGFAAASPPAAGALKREGAACDVWAPAPAPKSGLFALPAAVVGVLDSAGLFKPPKRPPAPPGAGAVD